MVTVLGRTFNPEALKQPRGFMRLLQCFFAMLAFSCCAGFGSSLSFKITCTDAGDNSSTITETVKADYSYPFALDKIDPHTLDICGIGESKVYFPGDFGSDAKFFVFIGVICWLHAILSLLVYTFMADVYEEEQKNYPIYDLVISGFFAFFWLACSSAWGHGLSGLKSSGDPDNWIFQSGDNALAPICAKNSAGSFIDTNVQSCETLFAGNFAGGNISVVLGFLNLFLWSANIWFLYKETKWFKPNTEILNEEQNASYGSID